MFEFGVWEGRSINLLANALPERTIYGFDSFEGLPEAWRGAKRTFDKGSFSAKGKVPHAPDNVKFIKGWYEDTLPEFFQSYPSSIALCHIDCDLYSSTKTVLKHIRPFIRKSTILLFDELINYPHYARHEMKAWLEFLEETRFQYKYLYHDSPDKQVVAKIVLGL